ncbi:1,4-alpha-glucan branching protein GlgB [Oxalobacter formigenes]|uniref:1,4-alpha-glucan branching enzyme GlgB n=1 Tax=Oxalobacter formigenes OXCC13 TaxID=556269 RepID=C3XB20_OXAFO|nr:1,4-alpha-glucan branching protein GlgB [Oxalobacter formigenes]ARQ45443.1 1,4-alpha-glucan branching enzyme GlgB [Oxalobacter formigenes]ARQ77719.1 glycogen-branching enzyme [Oxalobacter formigenes OXCC13]EEO30396.1 1,4-alpha-glucan branching enzyme [Oxalobacter formigenes OXCC13]MCZ4061882.1 1,4-alpha-glucan branching protein GlgB [Oxalobacter formigenes]WAW02112.1 1,4-alpha-glucan branching protein GlgB [Oxalobacter formigenes]
MRNAVTPEVLELVIRGDYKDPFTVLGMHREKGKLIVRALLPQAVSVAVVDSSTGKKISPMQRWGVTALFVAEIAGKKELFPYRLEIDWGDHVQVMEDPYRFPPVLGDIDVWLLSEGTHHRPYEKLGAHPIGMEGVQGVSFAVWAPNARRVSVVGDFNGWDGRRHVMRFRHECGVWEMFIPHVMPGDFYKYEILTPDGKIQLKADPYAFRSQLRPDTASVVHWLPPLIASDQKRKNANALDAPVSIYEVHLGSWRLPQDGRRWLSYRELAEQLIPYVRSLAFTHIELMPVNEHPLDDSWGYQPTGLYAPTARFGTPEDFRYFVQTAHDNGIGVILDWVPAHFPADAHGLVRFDGTALYEYADPKEGIHQDWGSVIYNYSRTEVSNYLVGNALYWIERYGVDGLRVDAVASMLYRDYSRAPGQWVPNKYGGRENLEAIAFLRKMNEIVGVERPEAVTMAEESTSFPSVSRPVWDGGLGFHYKWNLGWMHDTLAYMHEDPVHRKWHHDKMRFGLMYAYFENFILPLSHDEVVHCKGSLIGKMPGDEWQRFANLRAYYGFMWGFPGKKLLFMGGEFGQYNEWNSNGSLDWNLLQYPLHAGIQRVIRDLNTVYRDFPPLYKRDFDPDGFEWIIHDDLDSSVFSFIRKDENGRFVIVMSNFTPVPRYGYRFGVPEAGWYREIINTDAVIYGGSGIHNNELLAQPIPCNGYDWSVEVTAPPLATCMLVKKEE